MAARTDESGLEISSWEAILSRREMTDRNRSGLITRRAWLSAAWEARRADNLQIRDTLIVFMNDPLSSAISRPN